MRYEVIFTDQDNAREKDELEIENLYLWMEKFRESRMIHPSSKIEVDYLYQHLFVRDLLTNFVYLIDIVMRKQSDRDIYDEQWTLQYRKRTEPVLHRLTGPALVRNSNERLIHEWAIFDRPVRPFRLLLEKPLEWENYLGVHDYAILKLGRAKILNISEEVLQNIELMSHDL